MDKFKTKKSLGQNFLQEQSIINKIIATANITEEQNILEIGPGQGALTTKMLKSANKVLAVEIDQRLIQYLKDKYSEYDNFELINKDFLQTSKEDFEYILDKPIKMVANLPYYITTPIILKTLMEYDFIDEIYIMIQKEVALRFSSEYKKKTYGSISVFLQSIAEVKYEFDVKNTYFKPVPKVDSAVLSIKRKNIKAFDYEKYETFLKACFLQKRKLLSNNLSSFYKADKNIIVDFLNSQGYEKNIRPEEIKVNEYLKLYEEFYKNFF